MICKHCGTQIPDGATFCPHCGNEPVENTYQQSAAQTVYRQPVYQQPYDPTTEVMSVGSYIGVFILSAIPIVNIICWIVWLVSANTNKNKKNYIIANIVLFVIGIVLFILVMMIASVFDISLS